MAPLTNHQLLVGCCEVVSFIYKNNPKYTVYLQCIHYEYAYIYIYVVCNIYIYINIHTYTQIYVYIYIHVAYNTCSGLFPMICLRYRDAWRMSSRAKAKAHFGTKLSLERANLYQTWIYNARDIHVIRQYYMGYPQLCVGYRAITKLWGTHGMDRLGLQH